jgi:flagellar hook assembly protein FlgD
MDGLFHKELRLIKNNDGTVIGVVVGGPIKHWESDEASASIHATITAQNGVTVSGGTSEDVANGAHDWFFAAVVDDDALEASGSATGVATAIIRTTDGKLKTGSWTSPAHPEDPPEIKLS